jgi:hypothetical protein
MIAMALRGGAKSKIGKARFGKVPSDHNTTRIFKGLQEKNFQKKKKMAGEDPLDPLFLLPPVDSSVLVISV